ncbi:MAG: endonuclease III [Nanoarchaeota archaeon]
MGDLNHIRVIKRVFSLLEEELKEKNRQTMLDELKNSTPFHAPFQILAAAMLSSRTKDTTTLPVVKKLFAKYPHPHDFVGLDVQKLEKMLYGLGFYKIKAANLKKLSKIIVEQYKGDVPASLPELISLPGVGRKTANCVLAYAFNKPAIAVDVHVHRIANRLGWVKTDSPEKTEEELKKIIPREMWRKVNRLFVAHGQNLCFPLNPKCASCPVEKYCKKKL